MKYIGQDGRVHVLGDAELMHYNHNHDKLGRFSSSGGAAKIGAIQNRIEQRDDKIARINSKLNSKRNLKKRLKADKYNLKATKARKKRFKNEFDIERAEKYTNKAARKSYKLDKLERKRSKLEYKNIRDQKRIDRLQKKVGNIPMDECKRANEARKDRVRDFILDVGSTTIKRIA